MMLQPVKRTAGSTFVNATISASKARNFFFISFGVIVPKR